MSEYRYFDTGSSAGCPCTKNGGRCPDRCPGCHSVCGAYLKYEAAKIRAEREKESRIIEY